MDNWIRVTLLAVMLFVPQAVFAQESDLDLNNGQVALHIPFHRKKVEITPAFEDYTFMLFDVCDAMQLTDDECQIYPMNGDLGGNAIATELDGNKLVVYDRKLSDIVGLSGAQMIIAHEVGHHVCGHLDEEPSSQIELEADRFAASAMRLLGLSLEDTLSTVSILSERPSKSHPANTDRVRSMVDGWKNPETGKQCLGASE